jgi:hypothetical protein
LRRRRFGIELDQHHRFLPDDPGIVPRLRADEWIEVRRSAEAWRINQPVDAAIRGPDAIDDTATPLLVGGTFARGKQVP